MFKGKEYAYGEVLKFMYVSKLCYPTKCCVLCIHSLKLSLKHNEEKTMLFAVWQTLLFHIHIYSIALTQEAISNQNMQNHIYHSPNWQRTEILSLQGQILILLAFYRITNNLFNSRNKMYFMVIHKIYCFLPLPCKKLLQDLQ